MQSGTFIPCNQLKPFVKRLALHESLNESVYKVLPDTSIVMGFQYKGGISCVSGAEETGLSPYGITGLPESFRYFKNRNDTGTILVSFNEIGASRFFKEPLHELYGKSISLDEIVPQSQMMQLQERLQEAKTGSERIRLVQDFLISRISFGVQDVLVSVAVQHIRRSNGMVRMNVLAKELCVSKSVLEKRFRRVVGTSPKKFALLVRFRFLLEQYHRDKTLLTELSYNTGFYDQAHFIKQFKTFTGEAPNTFFSHSK